MDISEYPPFVFWFGIAVLLRLVWLYAKRIEYAKLRLTTRLLTGLAALIVSAPFCLFADVGNSCNVRGKSEWNPDGSYVAVPSRGLQGAQSFKN